MKIIADLHIHGKYSRGCSTDISVANLEKYARLKGVSLLGTGDFTHSGWLTELNSNLKEDDYGILRTKTGFPFIWQTEISMIYSQDGKGRRVHNVILAPSGEVATQITDFLKSKGRVDYDGRPIFGFSCIELADELMKISKDIEIIPAHVWTPWFSIFGSNSGFDSVEECFKEKAKFIHALETGMSSDPAMNWRLSKLDNYALVSFSDMHSFWPWRIGREATVFDIDLEYKNLINAIRTGKGLTETIEVDPNYGKYHFDGHRNCDVCMDPKNSIKLKDICPKCGKKMTIGVLHRVEQLADRPEGFVPKNAKQFKTLIPLSEILSSFIKSGVASKKTWSLFYELVNKFGSEMNVMLEPSFEELKGVVDEKIAKAIIDNRNRNVKIQPGYDGEYGKPLFNNEKIETYKGEFKNKQTGLDKFM